MSNAQYTIKALYVHASYDGASFSTLSEAFAYAKSRGFSFAVYDNGARVGTWCPIGGRCRELINAMGAT